MKATLTVDTMYVIKCWADAPHHTHMDCRGHTGAMASLGKGSAVSYPGKHKINKKISMDSEIISADGMLVKMLSSL